MEKPEYRATLSRSKGRSNLCVIFRHPLRMTTDGRPGRRVRRSMGTTDKNEVKGLVDQLNEILSEKSMWTPGAKGLAERKYDKRIVSAFYDRLTPALHDSKEVRDKIWPLPGKGDGYFKIGMVNE